MNGSEGWVEQAVPALQRYVAILILTKSAARCTKLDGAAQGRQRLWHRIAVRGTRDERSASTLVDVSFEVCSTHNFVFHLHGQGFT